MRKNRLSKKNCNDIFLNRTLSYNQQYCESIITEYYLHTITKKNLSKDDLVTIIRDFQLARKKDEETHLVYVNLLNLRSILIELDEKDYHVSLLACIICKHSFNNIAALILHYYFIHSEYEYNQTKIDNPHTNMKETHIFLSINKKDILEDSSNNSKILTIISDKENRFELAYKIINSLDISKLISQPQIVETQNKKRGNVSKNCEYKSKKYLIDDNNEHFFFHIYTGEIVDPYDPTMNYSQYDIDYNYVQYLENKEIDKQRDTDDKQKLFFKLWNNYVSSSGIIANNKIEMHIFEFVRLNIKDLVHLKHQFFFHLRTLYDYSFLTKNQLINILLVLTINHRISEGGLDEYKFSYN